MQALFMLLKKEPNGDSLWRRFSDGFIALGSIVAFTFICGLAYELYGHGLTKPNGWINLIVWGHIVFQLMYCLRRWKDFSDKPWSQLTRNEFLWKGSYELGPAVIWVAFIFVLSKRSGNMITSWMIAAEFVFLFGLMFALLTRCILLSIWAEKLVGGSKSVDCEAV